jgi:ATP:ADP antiporter, AAA family
MGKLTVAWLWFFLLLTSYYVLKPIRDANGTELAEHLNYWYVGSFAANIVVLAVYAKLVRWLSPRWLTTIVYEFFALCLLGFMAVGTMLDKWPIGVNGAFYIWVSVFNLVVVAVFWSTMTDVFTPEESKSWFGVLASAGSIGAIVGSGFTMWQSQKWGTVSLLAVSFGGLQMAVILAHLTLGRRSNSQTPARPATPAETEIRPSLIDGLKHVLESRYLLGICLFVFLGKVAATYFYNNLQLSLKSSEIGLEARTSLFATMNLWTQIGSMLAQGVLFAWLIKWFGLRTTISIPALTLVVLMVGLYGDPTLNMLIIAQVTQQIVGYGLMTPGQNVLFTMLSKQDRYVSKGFIDTVLFRFSDVVASQMCTAISRSGLALGTASLAMIPLLMVWAVLSWNLGKKHDRTLAENNC